MIMAQPLRPESIKQDIAQCGKAIVHRLLGSGLNRAWIEKILDLTIHQLQHMQRQKERS